jgi:predicted PhzF superfamily epimerase YddE/YHI9
MLFDQKHQVRVFSKGGFGGSLQNIYVFKTKTERDLKFKKKEVLDDLDYSFAVLDEGCVDVRWKNKAGEIQFCGSGAYALACFVFKDSEVESLDIKNNFIELKANKIEGQIVLSFPEAEVNFIENSVYKNLVNGVYFEEAESFKDLKEFSGESKDVQRKVFLSNPQGYCLFFWDKEKQKGCLRYFCPWHGRDEDSVTGSIQASLTPLVAKIYGALEQSWEQFSQNSSGFLKTKCDSEKVFISGDYKFLEE